VVLTTGVAVVPRRASRVAARQVPPRAGLGGVEVNTSEVGGFCEKSCWLAGVSAGELAVRVYVWADAGLA
jgi:hypothetical protein